MAPHLSPFQKIVFYAHFHKDVNFHSEDVFTSSAFVVGVEVRDTLPPIPALLWTREIYSDLFSQFSQKFQNVPEAPLSILCFSQ